MRKGFVFVAALVFLLIGAFSYLQQANAHGSMQDPLSRVFACYLEGPEAPDTPACGNVVANDTADGLYNWHEIHNLNANGQHQANIPDGKLCSGGLPRFATFDQPRDDWYMTALPAGSNYTLKFDAYVPHNFGQFEMYITRDGFDPTTEPLKWSDLELFATVVEPPLMDGDYQIPVTLPNKTGRRILYTIWQRYDSPEAFYSCSDVWFGPGPMPTPELAGCTEPAYSPSVRYSIGDRVTYNGSEWQARWDDPSAPSSSAQQNGWLIVANCIEGGATPTATSVVPTATSGPPTATGVAPTATAVPPTATSAPPTATSVPPSGECVVDYNIVNQWNSGFQADVTIINNTNQAINGYTLTWTMLNGEVAGSGWNVNLSQSGSAVTASNAAGYWNGSLPANGGTSTFGFNGSGTPVEPVDFVLNGVACNGGDPQPTATTAPPTATSVPPTATNVPPTATSVPPTATNVPPTATNVPPTATSVPATATSAPPTATAVPPTATSVPPTATSIPGGGDCAVDYQIVNQWNSGYQVNVAITNTGSSAVSGYTLSWDLPAGNGFSSGWNATYSQSGNTLNASNPAGHWNGTIQPNGTVSFGFIGSYSGSIGMPTSMTLNGTTCSLN